MASIIDKAKSALHGHGNVPSKLPAKYHALVVEAANGPLVLKELELHPPPRGHILLKTIACGVCASDNGAISGAFHNPFPLVPGHEVIGTVVAIGDGEDLWKVGDMVGTGWFGGCCGNCTPCKHNMKQCCVKGQVSGVSRDGGYAEYVTVRREAAVVIPDGVDPVQYAPLLCAGVTVYNGLRQLNLFPGSLVAVQGLGGLGHLALQYSKQMGFKTVALSTSSSKQSDATKLGATVFVDGSKDDPVKKLQELGGADAIVVTGGSGEAVSKLISGLGPRGTLLTLSPAEFTVSTLDLILQGRRIAGWPSGSSIDSEETLAFAKQQGIHCMVEKFNWKDAQKALDHMNSGKVRFRGVLTF